MSLVNLGLLEGATLTAAGGTAVNFTPANGGVAGQIYLANATEADFRLRETVQAKASVPTQQANGEWSKDRRSMVINIPIYDSVSETYDKVTFRLERVAPVFATPTQLVSATGMAGQLCFDTDTAAFWATGSYA